MAVEPGTLSHSLELRLPTGRRLTVASQGDWDQARDNAWKQSAPTPEPEPRATVVTLEPRTWREDREHIKQDLGGWTGGGVWESAEILARLLMSEGWAERLRGARVCELGCGTGLVGLTAAGMGAEVTLTDRVLFVAEYNLHTNFQEEEERARHELRRLQWVRLHRSPCPLTPKLRRELPGFSGAGRRRRDRRAEP